MYIYIIYILLMVQKSDSQPPFGCFVLKPCRFQWDKLLPTSGGFFSPGFAKQQKDDPRNGGYIYINIYIYIYIQRFFQSTNALPIFIIRSIPSHHFHWTSPSYKSLPPWRTGWGHGNQSGGYLWLLGCHVTLIGLPLHALAGKKTGKRFSNPKSWQTWL